MYKYTKRLHNQTTDKTLFTNIVHALIVIEKDITIKPMIDTPTFIKRFTKWLKNEGYTNIQQVSIDTFEYKFNHKKLFIKEK